jgi:hypothetical protein
VVDRALGERGVSNSRRQSIHFEFHGCFVDPYLQRLIVVRHAGDRFAALETPAIASDFAAEGATQAEWSVRWWQWAGSFQYSASPVVDLTGERCGSGQKGRVWFLAGTYESSAIERTCAIPADVYLFFSLINYFVMPSSSCEGCLTCKQAVASAKEVTDDPMGLIAELDGVAIANLRAHRRASPGCFDLGARVFGGPRIYPAASDGYWLVLKPLSKGKHTLRLGGLAAVAAPGRDLPPRGEVGRPQFGAVCFNSGPHANTTRSCSLPTVTRRENDHASNLVDTV